MPVSVIAPVFFDTGSAGTVASGSVTIPATAKAGERAFLAIGTINTSVITVTTSGWTEVMVGGDQDIAGASQSATFFTRVLPGTAGQTSTEAGTAVNFTVGTGTRIAAGLIVVKDAGTPEGPATSTVGTPTTSFALPQITPTFDDAYLLCMVAGSPQALSTGITDDGIFEPTGATLAASQTLTSNGSGRKATAWFGKLQRSGGAGSQTPASNLTVDLGINANALLYAIPAVATASAVYTRRNVVEIDTTGSAGTMTLTQTDSTGETATISGPTAGVFKVTLPATHTQTLTFDLVATNGAATDTEEISITPPGSGGGNLPLVRVGGVYI